MFGFTGGKFIGALAPKSYDDVIKWSTFSTSGVVDTFKPTTDCVILTGSSLQLRGLIPNGTEQEVLLHNNTGGTVTIYAESTFVSAEYRFTSSSNVGFVLQNRQSMRVKYNLTVKRWFNAGLQPLTANSPLSVSANNLVSMTQATTSTNGWVSSADWNTFNNKIGGAGNASDIVFWASSSTLGYNNEFVWKNTTQRLGVQQATPLGAVHVRSIYEESVTDPVSFSSSLQLFTPNSTPSGSTASQQPGRIMNPDSLTAVENSSGSSPFSLGDTLDYIISAVYYDGDVTYTECAIAYQVPQVVMTNNNNGVDMTWATDSSGSLGAPSFYRVYRNINSSGFNDYYDVYADSYVDNGTDTFLSGPYPSLSQFSDYVANGTSRSYHAHSKDTQAGPAIDYFSASFETYGFTDNSSGKPYRVDHTVATGSTTARVLGDNSGAGFGNHIDGLTFTEYSDTWISGSTATPSILGYLSDGTVLNRNYGLKNYGVVSSINVYSGATLSTTTTDPNDGLYYIVKLDWGVTGGTGWKILRDADLDATYEDSHLEITGSTSGSYYDTNTSDYPFVDSAVVSPTGVIPPAHIIEKGGTSTTDAAHFILKGTSDYSRLEFQDSAGTVQSYISTDNDGTKIVASKLGLFTATPIARPTTGSASATLAAVGGAAINANDTFDGYTLKQVVKALRDIGILT